MTEPASHLRRYIRTTPRHPGVQIVGGVESVVERAKASSASPDTGAASLAAPPRPTHEHRRLATTVPSEAARWRQRWHELIARVRHRLEADEGDDS